MKILLSLPPNLAQQFHEIEGKSYDNWFCASDPVGTKLGSGGGTAHLLAEAWKASKCTSTFKEWHQQDPKILIHGGGQSRRLPAYAPTGKLLSPIPVFRWARGQRLSQHLLDMKMPLLSDLMAQASPHYKTLIASGDVLIRSSEIPKFPEVDVLCLGIWVKPEQVSHHGVFFVKRHSPENLAFALQKPGLEVLRQYTADHHFLIDVGIWLLSDKAIQVLMQKSGWNSDKQKFDRGKPNRYELYGDFGLKLGEQPTEFDKEIAGLSSAVVPLPQGEFYHFGRNIELIESSLRLQNLIQDQRNILHRYLKPHSSMFVLNAQTDVKLKPENQNIWIENSHVAADWELKREHIITGIPINGWAIKLARGFCLDMVPVGDHAFCIRPYGMQDTFRGEVGSPVSTWLHKSVLNWFETRGLSLEDAGIDPTTDLQQAKLFPVISRDTLKAEFVQWLIDPNPKKNETFRQNWLKERLSAEELGEKANLDRLAKQRKAFRVARLPELIQNAQKSVFYQLDLSEVAAEYAESGLDLPPDPKEAEAIHNIHDAMFRAEILRLRQDRGWRHHERNAFSGLRNLITGLALQEKAHPKRDVLPDQIVWARSPVRLDLAGGWTDTPPFCLIHGGRVVNIAVELNGQPPIQVYAKPINRPEIVIRSIDQSFEQKLTEFYDLRDYNQLGAAFAIPKAALALAGFLPEFAKQAQASLSDQLKAAGGGIELSLLAAIPKGSGLGTSSVLAATVLGALNNFFQLGWDVMEIGHRTLILEQMLTSGGGWQDQYGGILPGIKYLETSPGLDQKPIVRWLPDLFFSHPSQKDCMLLYYTGISRVAHTILEEIVRGMFLNSQQHLQHVHKLYKHAQQTCEVIQKGNYEALGQMVAKTWHLNKALDKGTNPPETQAIFDQIQDYLIGGKLLGAGGGGFLLMMAKDAQAAIKIRKKLESNPPNELARFVEFSVSKTGLQVTRS